MTSKIDSILCFQLLFCWGEMAVNERLKLE